MKSDTPKTQAGSNGGIVNILLLSLLLASTVLIVNKSYLKLLIRGHRVYARAQGYPTTMAELYAFYEYPPPGENAAYLYLEAFEYFVEWDEEDRKLLPIFGDVEIPPGEYMDETTLQVVSQYLDDNHDALILLHRAVLFPQCRYPIESNDNFISISHFREIRHGIKLLALESMYYVNIQRLDLADQTLIDSFILANSLKNEPLLTSWLVKAACDALNYSIVEDIINLTALPPGFQTELVNRITQIDFDNALKRAVIGEYAFAFDERYSICFQGREQVLYLENLGNCLDTMELSMPERFHVVEKKVQLDDILVFHESLFQQAINPLWYSIHFSILYETKKRLVITALSIEQYRHDHNELPESLKELVPDYLDAVLKDPYDGSVLRYKILEKGYVVYSVGEDLTDNDGTKEDANGDAYTPGADITFTVRR